MTHSSRQYTFWDPYAQQTHVQCGTFEQRGKIGRGPYTLFGRCIRQATWITSICELATQGGQAGQMTLTLEYPLIRCIKAGLRTS